MKKETWLIYKAISPSNKVYIGITSRSLKMRIYEHFMYAKVSNNGKFQKALNKYKLKVSFSIIEKTSSFNNAIKKEIYWIKYYNSYKKGYNSTIGGEGKKILGNSDVILIARKYKTKGSWARNHKSSYNAAIHRGIFDLCVKHMVPAIKYTSEIILKRAKKYKYIKDWKKLDKPTYDAASRNGILKEATKHMIRLKTIRPTNNEFKEIE